MQAQQAIQQGDYKTAVDTIDQLPEKSDAALAVRSQALQAMNQDTLGRARMPLKLSQASEFNRAIAEARKVKPGEPLYDQAQADIQRWSRVMLDLAKGRARQGEFAGALAAARLIPADVESVKAERDQVLEQWSTQQQQQVTNRQLLAQAFRLLQPGNCTVFFPEF